MLVTSEWLKYRTNNYSPLVILGIQNNDIRFNTILTSKTKL